MTLQPEAIARLRLHQPLPPDLKLEPQEADSFLKAEITARRRGRHRLASAAARTVGPLGLGVTFHRVAGDSDVLVYPDMPAAHALALSVRYGTFRQEGRRPRGPLGLGTEFESIREYLPDDDIRQVNWRATARMGTPMSNVHRVEHDREVMCLIDCGRLMAAPIQDRTRLDAAVDATAAMAAVAEELGDRMGVMAFDHGVRRLVKPRRNGGPAVLAAVFDLEPSEQDSDYELAFRRVAAAKRSFILILTDILEENAARPLVEAMPVLARHHQVAVASVVDDDLESAVSTRPQVAADAYRAVAALGVLEARAKVIVMLGHAGAQVVEAPLGLLSTRCVGAYLEAKARGRL